MADWTSSVRSYLRQTLLTVTSLPPIAYEGRLYTPTIGEAWLREQLLPVDSEVETLGSQGLVREDFIYRLTLSSSFTGVRLTTHEDLVDRIRAKFFPGHEIRDLSSTVFGIVTRCTRGMSLTDADWMYTPISIYAYFHRATRAA